MTCCSPRHRLGTTESVCPVCLETIPAERVAEGDTVFLEKTCPRHGAFRTPVWRGLRSWMARDAVERAHSRPSLVAGPVARGCPRDCGLCPDHRQQSCCVLLEVTSRCDLSCPICFASAGRDGRDLPMAEIERRLDTLAAAGGRVHIQLSGGEPTVRDDLPAVVARIRERGFEFVQLNTNGVRLAREPAWLEALAAAGLDCVFLQFDGPDDRIHREIRGARLQRLKELAIARCAAVGVGVVLVPTVVPGVNDDAIGSILDFAVAAMPAVRAVHFQPVSWFGRHGAADFDRSSGPPRVTLPEIVEKIVAHSGGTLRFDDFRPGSAEHPHCSFSARVRVGPDGGLHPSGVAPASCCGTPVVEDGAPAAPGGALDCCGSSRPSADVARARRWVADQWRADLPAPAGEGLDAFDRFLAGRDRMLGISGMAFQDAWSLDLERLRQCHIHVVEGGDRLVPFCAYNLTNCDGRPLWRGTIAATEEIA